MIQEKLESLKKLRVEVEGEIRNASEQKLRIEQAMESLSARRLAILGGISVCEELLKGEDTSA